MIAIHVALKNSENLSNGNCIVYRFFAFREELVDIKLEKMFRI